MENHKTRVQFDIIKDRLDRIDDLIDEVHMGSRKEFFDNALSLFEFIIRQEQKGMTSALVNEITGQYSPLLLPALTDIRHANQYKASQAAQQAISPNNPQLIT